MCLDIPVWMCVDAWMCEKGTSIHIHEYIYIKKSYTRLKYFRFVFIQDNNIIIGIDYNMVNIMTVFILNLNKYSFKTPV